MQFSKGMGVYVFMGSFSGSVCVRVLGLVKTIACEIGCMTFLGLSSTPTEGVFTVVECLSRLVIVPNLNRTPGFLHFLVGLFPPLV